MTAELQEIQTKLDEALTRIDRLEKCLGGGVRHDSTWRYLIPRPHAWRRQLYIKGRNMTVRHLVGTVKASRFTEEQAAQDLHLPVKAIREALAYFEANPEVIALDHATEMYLLSLEGGQRPWP